MPWIKTISEDEAEGALADFYAVRRRAGQGRFAPDRVKVLTLWPELLRERWDLERELYRGSTKGALGHRRLEMVLVVTAALIGCHY